MPQNERFADRVQVWELPSTWLKERVTTPYDKRHPFARQATFFEYVVTRCVKWAFVNLDSEVGCVFLGPRAASWFFAFRRWRHGYWTYPFVRRDHRDETGVRDTSFWSACCLRC